MCRLSSRLNRLRLNNIQWLAVREVGSNLVGVLMCWGGVCIFELKVISLPRFEVV
jgi:hypothetical protein